MVISFAVLLFVSFHVESLHLLSHIFFQTKNAQTAIIANNTIIITYKTVLVFFSVSQLLPNNHIGLKS